jgi:hypothetical protein
MTGPQLDKTNVGIYTAESDRKSKVKSTACPQKGTEIQRLQENTALLE